MQHQDNTCRMRRLTLNAPRKLTLGQAEIPACGADEALLKMVRVGVCGTDMLIIAAIKAAQGDLSMLRDIFGEMISPSM